MIGDRDRDRLGHMVRNAEAAVELLGARDIADLEADTATRYAVAYALQTVGEAASRISAPTRKELPDIPWADIIGMRHHFVHGYDDVLQGIVVRTIREDLPVLIAQLQTALGGPR
jgi:uncharacterized protein with HEPN domain